MLLDAQQRGTSVMVEAGHVAKLIPAAEPIVSRAERSASPVLSVPANAVVASGAINAHTHLYSGLVPFDMPEVEPPPENFLQILERLWWRLDRALDADALRAAARYYIGESLLAGTTTLIDHHESPQCIEGCLDILGDAAAELGIRLLTCYGATERNAGSDEATRGLQECRRFIEDNRRPLVRGAVGLHASFTISDDTIRRAGTLAAQLGVVTHVHVAEDIADVADAKQRGFAGPLERLLELDALPPGSILAHGVHLNEAQVRRAEAAGLTLVQNPRSNEGNRVGYPAALAASARVALGTDGYAANMADEWHALQRLAAAHGDGAALEPRRAGGYQMCGELFTDRFAERVEPGVVADLVVGVPGTKPTHVLVAGQVVVRDGALVHADFDELRADASAQASRLWQRMRAL